MRSSLLHRVRRYGIGFGLFVSSICLAAACSSSNGDAVVPPPAALNDAGSGATDAPVSPMPDGSMPSQDGASSQDAATDAEQPLTVATEVEPNNGATKVEIGAMVLPGTMNGKIDPANDIDIFTIQLSPGEFWNWTATPTTADLAPHVIIFDTDTAGRNPNEVGFAAPGATAKLQHFVLSTGMFVVAVRDERNVPTATGKGGPTYGYALTGTRVTPSPIAVTFPVTKTGKLASIGSVDLYKFTGTNGQGFDVSVRAASASSTIDSRISIFDIPAKSVVGTNDDDGSTSDTRDTKLGSASPAPSTYMVIVENEGTDATDLSYEIQFSLR
jgi:hypothetical protein